MLPHGLAVLSRVTSLLYVTGVSGLAVLSIVSHSSLSSDGSAFHNLPVLKEVMMNMCPELASFSNG